MKLIKSLMRSDIISMGVSKKKLAVFLFIIGINFLPGLLMEEPILVIYLPVVAGLFVPVMLFDLNNNNGGENFFSVIPTDRKSRVIARFLLSTIIMTVFIVLCFIIVYIKNIIGNTDVFGDVYKTVFGINEGGVLGIYNIMLSFMSAVGMTVMSVMMKHYFSKGPKAKKAGVLRIILYIIAAYVCLMLVSAAVTAFFSLEIFSLASEIFMAVFSTLAGPADGLIVTVILLAFGYGMIIYNGMSAYINYEKREL